MKFGRTYTMPVQVKDAPAVGPVEADNTLLIAYPLTLEFDVQRSTLSSAASGRFRIYNLTPDHRKQIHHDWWRTDDYKKIVLNAGYTSDPKIPIIFQGNIKAASSYRQGPNWITDIEAFSGIYAIQNAQVSLSLGSGFDVRKALLDSIATMHNVTPGAVGDFAPPQSARGLTLMGNSWDVIQSLSQGGEAFIDNERVNVLQKDEYIDFPGQIVVINSETGLLDTPRQFDQNLCVDILFEPRLSIGQLVRLETAETAFSGDYVIKAIHHRGVISGAVNGECRTTLTLWSQKGGVFTGVPLE